MKHPLAVAIVLCAASAALGRTAPLQPAAHPAVVRVIAPEDGAVSYGSGALIGTNETLGLVVTNWHVVRDASRPIMVDFPDGFRSGATVLATDRDWDLAALAIWRPDVVPISLATEAPRRGDLLTIAGYGKGWYRASAGQCTQYVSPGGNLPFEMIELDTAARQGDSGGPILNRRGELVGVLFGAGFGRTAGSYCGRVRWFLDSISGDFQRLTSESLLVAQQMRRDPVPTAGGPSANPTAIAQQQPDGPTQTAQQPLAQQSPRSTAPVAAIGARRSYPRLPGDAGEEPSRGHELADLPVPRSCGDTAECDASAPGRPLEPPQPAGPTRSEQIKSILAGIGILALLFHGLRLFGAAAES